MVIVIVRFHNPKIHLVRNPQVVLFTTYDPLDVFSGNTTYEFLTRIVTSTDRIKSTQTFISLDF